MQAPGLAAGPPGITGCSGRSPPEEAPPPPPAGLAANPPGLGQPPGLGGLGVSGCPPPTAPPPPATVGQPPPATAAGGGAVGEGWNVDLQKEISGTIEAQVQRLIEQARLDTEAKVKQELKSIRDSIMVVDVGLDQLLAQLDGIEPPQQVEAPMDSEAVGQLLSKIEQQWGQEIRTLKQELHQTILAHNHNADLIKHHKDTMDALRERCLKLQHNTKINEIQQRLQKLDALQKHDARLKQQQKQKKLEPLFERLSVIEQRVAAATQGAAWRYSGISPMVPPGMPVPPGIPPGMMPHNMNSAAVAAAAAAAAAAASANVMGTAKGGGGKGAAGGGRGEKATFKTPTEDEVVARLSKLSTGADCATTVLGEPTTLPVTAEATAKAGGS
eukprot:TRINITY_DN660_c0_g1_i1.p1 TRINITY_DN660_c0_g1~~TRINITY_DN660_c0_g1_i1.p1  ORF type:complete len:386 (+),score=115.54 TRINITY_DN660_c0_g1_i1:92-1249(+)